MGIIMSVILLKYVLLKGTKNIPICRCRVTWSFISHSVPCTCFRLRMYITLRPQTPLWGNCCKRWVAPSPPDSMSSEAKPCRCQPSIKVTACTITIFTILLQNSFLAPSSHVSLVGHTSHFSLHAACKAAIWKKGPGCTLTGSPLWS